MKILCAALKRNLPIDCTRRLIVSKKVDTILDGNAVRKNQRFLTALPTLAVPKENNRLEREFSLTAAP